MSGLRLIHAAARIEARKADTAMPTHGAPLLSRSYALNSGRRQWRDAMAPQLLPKYRLNCLSERLFLPLVAWMALWIWTHTAYTHTMWIILSRACLEMRFRFPVIGDSGFCFRFISIIPYLNGSSVCQVSRVRGDGNKLRNASLISMELRGDKEST